MWLIPVSVPLRGYRIPNYGKVLIIKEDKKLFPSPDGAIEFQIEINSGKLGRGIMFPSPDGAIEFQMNNKTNNNFKLIVSVP